MARAETVAEIERPTRERVNQAAYGIIEPEVSQRRERRAHIVRDIWAELERRKAVDADEAASGRRFAAHLELAYRGRAVTQSYGDRITGSRAAGEGEARHVDYVAAHKAARDALVPALRLPMTLACDGQTLEAIGRLAGGQRERQRASVAATQLLRVACQVLTEHYRRVPKPG